MPLLYIIQSIFNLFLSYIKFLNRMCLKNFASDCSDVSNIIMASFNFPNLYWNCINIKSNFSNDGKAELI